MNKLLDLELFAGDGSGTINSALPSDKYEKVLIFIVNLYRVQLIIHEADYVYQENLRSHNLYLSQLSESTTVVNFAHNIADAIKPIYKHSVDKM